MSDMTEQRFTYPKPRCPGCGAAEGDLCSDTCHDLVLRRTAMPEPAVPTNEADEPGCVDCRFWRPGTAPEGHNAEYGACHRHAPRPFVGPWKEKIWDTVGEDIINEMREPIWPVTHWQTWCGEFEAIP